MKRVRILFFLFIISLITLTFMNGCYYDNQAELHPVLDTINILCDTSGTITYNGRVKDFMTTYCGSENSCHASTNNSGWDLSNYAGVVDAANNNLMDALNQINGASPMPKDAGKLDASCIAVIQKWIDQGKPEN